MRNIGTMSLAALIALFPSGLCAQTPEPAPALPQEVVEPEDLNYLFLGNTAFEEGAFEEAITAYSSLPEMGMPSYAHNRLALSYHLTNRLTEAEKLYKSVTKRDKELSAAYSNLGALYYGRRKFKDAENRFKDALKYDPGNLVLRYNLRAAKYARENGRTIRPVLMEEMASNPLLVGEPEGDLVRVKFLMPADTLAEVTLLERRGDSFLARKMFEDAIIEYQRALKINKYNPSIANRLGIAYHQSQRLKDAERQYKAALKINKYYLQALNNLGSVEYTRKRYRRAINYYGRPSRSRPTPRRSSRTTVPACSRWSVTNGAWQSTSGLCRSTRTCSITRVGSAPDSDRSAQRIPGELLHGEGLRGQRGQGQSHVFSVPGC